jgi:hypothetical protein
MLCLKRGEKKRRIEEMTNVAQAQVSQNGECNEMLKRKKEKKGERNPRKKASTYPTVP